MGGIARGDVGGPFLISACTAGADGKPDKLIGVEPVLSLCHVSDFASCQNHLDVGVHVPPHGWSREQAEKQDFVVRVHTRGNSKGPGELNGKKLWFEKQHTKSEGTD